MEGTAPAMQPLERTRRFWRAHGRSFDHLTLLHAFGNNPTIEWTPEGLCLWDGLRVDRAEHIIREFARSGIVERVPGRGERYRWNGSLDWAIARSPAQRRVVEETWTTGRSAG